MAVEDAARPRVVVGVDGSPGARAALAWALSAAAARAAVLEVIATFPMDFYRVDAYLLDPRRVDELCAATDGKAREVLNRLRRAPAAAGGESPAGARLSGVETTVTVLAGPPAEHLVRQSRGADLLVVGSRGRTGVRSALLGSVGLHCAAHARCPVVVVPAADAVVDNRVVVGLVDTAASRAALHAAAAEAAVMAADLELIVAQKGVARPVGEWEAEAERGAHRQLAEALVERQDRHRSAIRTTIEKGDPGELLVRRADGARLLVVGSHTRSEREGVVLGSVALHCVRHAPCPVMVVHAEGAAR